MHHSYLIHRSSQSNCNRKSSATCTLPPYANCIMEHHSKILEPHFISQGGCEQAVWFGGLTLLQESQEFPPYDAPPFQIIFCFFLHSCSFGLFVIGMLFLSSLFRRRGPGRNLYCTHHHSSCTEHPVPRHHTCTQNDLAWGWNFPIRDLKVLTTFDPVRDSHKFAVDGDPWGRVPAPALGLPQKPSEPYCNNGYPVILTAQILGDQDNMIVDAGGLHAAVYMWCIFIRADTGSKATTF